MSLSINTHAREKITSGQQSIVAWEQNINYPQHWSRAH